MKASSDFELFVQNLETHEKPSRLLRRKVIELGGTWHDMDVTALFEIHFLGVAASGWGAEDATAELDLRLPRRLYLSTVTTGACLCRHEWVCSSIG